MRTFAHLLVAGALVLTACAPSKDKTPDPNRLALKGTVPVNPLPKVDFTLTDTHGRPFNFRKETDGKITLLYFGYTYCPDVCPLQMATLAAAMKELDPSVRKRVEVVFVSVDPERDTRERLAHWLGSFDTTFVGLRGTDDQIAKALAFYNFPAPKQVGEKPNYSVSHPALVYAFTPDNLGRGMYDSETTRAIWVHDLNLIASHDWSQAMTSSSAAAEPSPSDMSGAGTAVDASPGAASGSASDTGSSANGSDAAGTSASDQATAGNQHRTVRVLDAYAPRPATGDATAMYLTLLNTGSEPDTLLSLSTGAARSASLHTTRKAEGVEQMVPMDFVPLPPGDTVRLQPGGMHVMLEGLAEELRPGSTFTASLIFAKAGTVPATVRVVTYAQMRGG